MALNFNPPKHTYDRDRHIVRFLARDEINRLVACGVSRIALNDLAGGNETEPDKLVAIYLEHAREIHATASRAYEAGQREESGLLLVTAIDLIGR